MNDVGHTSASAPIPRASEHAFRPAQDHCHTSAHDFWASQTPDPYGYPARVHPSADDAAGVSRGSQD